MYFYFLSMSNLINGWHSMRHWKGDIRDVEYADYDNGAPRDFE